MLPIINIYSVIFNYKGYKSNPDIRNVPNFYYDQDSSVNYSLVSLFISWQVHVLDRTELLEGFADVFHLDREI